MGEDPIERLKNSFASKNLTEVTSRRWLLIANDFLSFLEKRDMTFSKADEQTVKDYLAFKKRVATGNTMRTTYYILKSLFKYWGKGWKLDKYDVPHGLEPERPFFTVDETKKIMQAGKDRCKQRNDFIGLRDLVMLLISAEYGVRRIQIQRLDREHFAKDKVLSIPPAKGGRWVKRKPMDETIKYLEMYLVERKKFMGDVADDPKSPLFVDRSRERISPEAMGWAFVDIKKMAGVDKPGGSFHGLRRSKATRLHQGGMSETEISMTQGWKEGSREPGIYIQLDQGEVQAKAKKADELMGD